MIRTTLENSLLRSLSKQLSTWRNPSKSINYVFRYLAAPIVRSKIQRKSVDFRMQCRSVLKVNHFLLVSQAVVEADDSASSRSVLIRLPQCFFAVLPTNRVCLLCCRINSRSEAEAIVEELYKCSKLAHMSVDCSCVVINLA